jgi:hypothetical protein
MRGCWSFASTWYQIIGIASSCCHSLHDTLHNSHVCALVSALGSLGVPCGVGC